MRHDIIIGMLSDYDHTDIVNIDDLYKAIQDEYCIYTIDQYCDFRYSTNLTRFTYDPFDGSKIDWKEVKKELMKMN